MSEMVYFPCDSVRLAVVISGLVPLKMISQKDPIRKGKVRISTRNSNRRKKTPNVPLGRGDGGTTDFLSLSSSFTHHSIESTEQVRFNIACYSFHFVVEKQIKS